MLPGRSRRGAIVGPRFPGLLAVLMLGGCSSSSLEPALVYWVFNDEPAETLCPDGLEVLVTSGGAI